MRRTLLIIAGATALLAACGEKAGEKADVSPVDASTGPQSAGDVKAEVAKVKLKPGQWLGSFTLEDIEMTGMPGGAPAQMKDQMKRMMSRTDVAYCVTPEEAENPDGRLFSGQENKDCTYSGFEASGGAIKGQVSCKGEGGARMTAVMSGTYAAESYQMRMDMKTQGGEQGGEMRMTARTSGKWTGATCS